MSTALCVKLTFVDVKNRDCKKLEEHYCALAGRRSQRAAELGMGRAIG
jgi:hypothetical protein